MLKLKFNTDFNSFIDYIWHPEKSYIESIKEISGILNLALSESNMIQVPNNIIAAIWYSWMQRVLFLKNTGQNKLEILSRSFCLSMYSLLSERFNSYYIEAISNRLWKIYQNLVEYAHGNLMNSSIEAESIKSVAEFCAQFNIQKRSKLYDSIKAGLTKGTSEYDCLEDAFLENSVNIEKKRIDDQLKKPFERLFEL